MFQLDAPSENLSLNFWCGTKGTEGFLSQLRDAPLPTAAAVAAAAADAASTAARAARSAAEQTAVEVADEALLEAEPPLAFSCLHAGRIIESAATKVMDGDTARGNYFLAALAAGADATWPPASAAASNARRIRSELIALLGSVAAANALLRLVSRDGRLSPGLAPPVAGDVVNSEKGGTTPAAEVESWFACRRKTEEAR